MAARLRNIQVSEKPDGTLHIIIEAERIVPIVVQTTKRK